MSVSIFQAASSLREQHPAIPPVATQAHPNCKIPLRKGWDDYLYEPGSAELSRHFSPEGRGLAGRWGEGAIDIDMEGPKISRFAPFFFPDTDFCWGREGNRASHRAYACETSAKTVKFYGPDGKTLLVEVRGKKSMSTLPPSMHPTGVQYEFEVTPITGWPQLVEAEYAVLQQGASLLTLAVGLEEFYGKGGRDELCFILVGVLARHEFTRDQATALIEALTSVYGDEQSAARLAKVEKVYSDMENGTPPPGYRKLAENTSDSFMQWVRKTLRVSAPKGGIESPDLQDVADWFADTYGEGVVYRRNSDEWMLHTPTHWLATSLEAPELDLKIVKAMRDMGVRIDNTTKINQVLRLARPALAKDFPDNPHLVNLLNGTLNTRTWKMQDHNKEDGMTNVLPFAYQPGPSPKIDRFLVQTMPDEMARQAYEEHVGMALLKGQKLHKALVLYGPGGSGKSTAAHLACLACGQDPAANPGPVIFEGSSEGMHSRAVWFNKLLVVINELPAEAFREGELFKAMVSHEAVSMRHLYTREQAVSSWQAKILMTTNDKPRFSDPRGAIARRLVIVECPNGRSDNSTDPAVRMNINLLDTLKDEVPQFAIRCVQRAVSALGRGEYSVSAAMRQMLQAIIVEGDSVTSWAEERAVQADAWTSIRNLYKDYKTFVQESGRKFPVTDNRFSSTLQSLYPTLTVIRRRDSIDGQQKGFLGLRLRMDDDPEPPQWSPSGPLTDGSGPVLPGQGESAESALSPLGQGQRTHLLPEGEPPVSPLSPLFSQQMDIVKEKSKLAEKISAEGPYIDNWRKSEDSADSPRQFTLVEGESAGCGAADSPPPADSVRVIPDPNPWEIPDWLPATKILALDTETAIAEGTIYNLKLNHTALDPRRGRLRLISLSDGTNSIVVDVWRHPDALEVLRQYICDPARTIVAHNAVFDMKWLMAAGYDLEQNWADTQTMSQILDGGVHYGQKGYHTLKGVAFRELALELDKEEQKSDWSQPTLTEEQLTYAAHDAAILPRIYTALTAKLATHKLLPTMEVEHQALNGVAAIEYNGMPINPALWSSFAEEAAEKTAILSPQLIEALGPINLNSHVQLKKALALQGVHLESTDEAHLKAVPNPPPALALLLEYRDVNKQATTYGHSWLAQHVSPVTGRIHPHYQQIVSTGRMSCSTPNMQNIPRGKHRKAFAVGPDRALIKCDYSQLEIRCAAVIANEPTMLAAYEAGVDLHKRTASLVLGIPEDQVTKAHRQMAKAVNFGLLYGMGAAKLQEYAKDSYQVELTLEEAQQYRSQFFKAYPALPLWHKQTTSILLQSNIVGEDRWIPDDGTRDIRTTLGRVRWKVAGYSQKLNSSVQGTGADCIKAALGDLYADRHRYPEALLIAVVHDEVVVECPVAQATEVAGWVKSHMEKAMSRIVDNQVRAEADYAICSDWGGTALVLLDTISG